MNAKDHLERITFNLLFVIRLRVKRTHVAPHTNARAFIHKITAVPVPLHHPHPRAPFVFLIRHVPAGLLS